MTAERTRLRQSKVDPVLVAFVAWAEIGSTRIHSAQQDNRLLCADGATCCDGATTRCEDTFIGIDPRTGLDRFRSACVPR
jgi:hypothetical protein